MTIAWPSALTPRRCHIELRNAARGGGVSLSGQEQRILSPAPRWEVTLAEMPVNNREQANAYRAMIARLRQGEEISVKVFDMWKPANYGTNQGTIAAAASLRATTLEINGSGIDVEAGSHFTIGARLYRVTEITDETETNVGLVLAVSGSANWNDAHVWVDDPDVVLEVKITPPLRVAVAEDAVANFNSLTVLCVLKDINDGDLDLDMGRFGLPSLTFVESLPL